MAVFYYFDSNIKVELANLEDTGSLKMKDYLKKACDKGNQEGCDKYRELNEKGVK